MRVINEKKAVGTGTPTCIFDAPLSKIHNFELRALGSVYVGDVDVSTSRGLPLAAGASRGYTHQDFRNLKNSHVKIYAVAEAATTVNIFGFIEE